MIDNVIKAIGISTGDPDTCSHLALDESTGSCKWRGRKEREQIKPKAKNRIWNDVSSFQKTSQDFFLTFL